MRKISLFHFGWIFLMGYSSSGQSNSLPALIPDTLYVSNASSTYLAFPKEIDLINIGSSDFVFQVEKSMVYLKAIRPMVKPTNLFIKCSNGILVMNLVYQLKPKKYLYDFRTLNFDILNPKQGSLNLRFGSPKSFNENESRSKKEINGINVPRGKDSGLYSDVDTSQYPFGISINKIQNSEDRFKTFGTAQNQITILLTNIFTDTKRMILKFKIINRSSLNYELDYVSFQFKRRTHYSQNSILNPLYSPVLTSCGPKTQETLVYILPLFGTATSGDFSVTFRELNGDRKETLEIPERAFKMAELF